LKFRVRGAESESGAESERFRVTASLSVEWHPGTRVTVTVTGRGHLEARLSTTEPQAAAARASAAAGSDGEPRRHRLTGRLTVALAAWQAASGRWHAGGSTRPPTSLTEAGIIIDAVPVVPASSESESEWQCQPECRQPECHGELEAARLETFRLGRKPEGRRFSNFKAPGSGSETLS
jgi:hypothetical protein